MPYLLANRTVFSASSSTALRKRLGITQEELGDMLGVSAAQVGHVEAGRRSFSLKARERLYRLHELLRAVPPETLSAPEPEAEPVPPPGPLPYETAALRKRLRDARHHLGQLRYQQQGTPRRTEMLARRHRALAALQVAVAASPESNPAVNPAVNPAREQEWLELLVLATKRATYQQPTPTAQAWQALRIQLLETEIAGLLTLLGEAPPAPGEAVSGVAEPV